MPAPSGHCRGQAAAGDASDRYERDDNVDIPPKFIIFRRLFSLVRQKLLIFAANSVHICRLCRRTLNSRADLSFVVLVARHNTYGYYMYFQPGRLPMSISMSNIAVYSISAMIITITDLVLPWRPPACPPSSFGYCLYTVPNESD